MGNMKKIKMKIENLYPKKVAELEAEFDRYLRGDIKEEDLSTELAIVLGVETEQKVKDIVLCQSGCKEVHDKDKFVDDLGMDSLDCVEMVMELEEEFNIAMPDEELEKLTTVKSLVEYVKEKTEKLK